MDIHSMRLLSRSEKERQALRHSSTVIWKRPSMMAMRPITRQSRHGHLSTAEQTRRCWCLQSRESSARLRAMLIIDDLHGLFWVLPWWVDFDE